MYVIIHAYVLFFSCDAIINNIVSGVKLVINSEFLSLTEISVVHKRKGQIKISESIGYRT